MKRLLLTVCVLVALAGSASLFPDAQAQGQGQGQGAVAVNIVNPVPLPVTGTVSVDGTVNVRDVNAAAAKPFQKLLRQGTIPNVPSFTVPANERLTIEFVSGECHTQNSLNDPTPGTVFEIQTTAGGTDVEHKFFPKLFRAFVLVAPLATYYYGSTDQTRLYADPGTTVSLGGIILDYSCQVTVSGYTVPQ